MTPLVTTLALFAGVVAWVKYRAIMDTYRHPRPPHPNARRPRKAPPE